MSRVALDSLGLGVRSHRSALAWLALLYCRPARWRAALDTLSARGRARAVALLALHALPWTLLPALVTQAVVEEGRSALAVLVSLAAAGLLGVIVGAAVGANLGLAVSLLGGCAVTTVVSLPSRAEPWVPAVIFGLAVGAASRLSGQRPFRADGLVLSAFTALVFGVSSSTPALNVTEPIGHGAVVGLACGLATLLMVQRAYLWPLHWVATYPGRDARRWYRLHPVAWDDVCDLPFPGFARLLIAYAEQVPAAGAAELARLLASVPQRWPDALRAHTALSVRAAAAETDLSQLPRRLAILHPTACGDAAHRALLAEWIAQIARQQTRLHALERPTVRLHQARLLHASILALDEKLAALPETLAAELKAAASRWSAQAQAQVDAALEAHTRTRERLPRVFRAGDPVDPHSEAFVPRYDVYAELQRQILGSGACPGLLLYGRRRTGKSTVLRNLRSFLPQTIHVAEASMHDPRFFTSPATLVEHLSERMLAALVDTGGPRALTSTDLLGFSRLLGQVDASLGEERRLLVALDELEFLDHKIGEGALGVDLLALLRDSLQSHRHVIWLLAGSAGLEELRHADWRSYLVSARTLEVGMFSEAQTHVLLTDPLAHSPLWAREDPNRPRFDAAFWGEHGPASIQRETGGWPHLVQLLAESVVDLIDDSGSRRVTPPLLQRAAARAVISGDAVLAQLVEGESRLPGEWEYVARFRTHEDQEPPEDDAVRRSLRRRLLVVEEHGRWRLRVPLMRRWLRERG